MGELAPYVSDSLQLKDAMLSSNKDHQDIIQSLKACDLQKLRACLKEHSESTQYRINLSLSKP